MLQRSSFISLGLLVAVAMQQPVSAASHGDLKACPLLSLLQVSTVLKHRATAQFEQDYKDSNTCTWSTASGPAMGLVVRTDATIMHSSQFKGKTVAQVFHESITSINGLNKVKGLGARAYWDVGNKQLWVLKADVFFQISGMSHTLPLRKQKALARLILAKL